MAGPHEVSPARSARHGRHPAGHGVVLALALLFVLTALSVSVGLVVYTAWRHDLDNGLFALAFAVLSARAALSWFLWHSSDQNLAVSDRQKQRADS